MFKIVVGASKICSPLRRTLPSAGPPKISRFFLSRHNFRSFLPSLGAFSWNFGGVFESQKLKCARLGSGCGVKPRRLRGRRGFTRQPENSKRAHFRALAPLRFKTPPKFHEKTPREREERKKNCGERGKKARNFGLPQFGPHPSGRHPSGPCFCPPWETGGWGAGLA